MLGRIVQIPLTALIIISFFGTAFAQIADDGKSYTLQEEETLIEIAKKLGNRDFWKPLYQANKDIIDEGMEAGQVLTIPEVVIDAPEFIFSASEKKSTEPAVEPDSQTPEEKDLEKFRDAFNKVIEQKKEAKNSKQTNSKSREQADPTLDLGVLILDETRSKLGGVFYNLFYQNWKAPEGASNFTITISEQPSFGRGTLVTIKIDYEKVFSARLQPRYEYIEAVSKQAVARAQREVQQQAEVRQQLTGY